MKFVITETDYIPEFEISIRTGLYKWEFLEIIAAWPDVNYPDEAVELAINGSLNEVSTCAARPEVWYAKKFNKIASEKYGIDDPSNVHPVLSKFRLSNGLIDKPLEDFLIEYYARRKSLSIPLDYRTPMQQRKIDFIGIEKYYSLKPDRFQNLKKFKYHLTSGPDGDLNGISATIVLGASNGEDHRHLVINFQGVKDLKVEPDTESASLVAFKIELEKAKPPSVLSYTFTNALPNYPFRLTCAKFTAEVVDEYAAIGSTL